MALVRCSKCGKAFERTPHVEQVCPHCGLRAPVVGGEDAVMPETVVGKPQRAIVVFLLTLLVQPVFWPLYLLLTFRPLDRQHGRDPETGPWVASLVPVLGLWFGLPYAWTGLRRLKRSRAARGLRRGIGPFWFGLAGLLLPLGAIGYLVYVVGTGNDTSAAFDGGLLGKASGYDVLGHLAAWQYLAAGAAYLLPPAIVLAIATASANGLWRAIYEERGEAWPWRDASAA